MLLTSSEQLSEYHPHLDHSTGCDSLQHFWLLATFRTAAELAPTVALFGRTYHGSGPSLRAHGLPVPMPQRMVRCLTQVV